MISYDLQGKTALVTGGASGIGLATVEILLRSGATVAMNYLPGDPRGEQEMTRLREAGSRIIAAPGDVGTAGAAEAMVETAIREMGGLDLLVNNAGTPATKKLIPPANLDEVSEEIWSTIWNVNLVSVFRCTKAAASSLKERGGSVVNTASIAGLGKVGSSIAYSAGKAALINLTKDLARALAPEARVNAIAPGAVDSPWMVEWTDEQRRNSIDQSLLKRRNQPSDLADVIVFLAFGTKMVTGHTVPVDAGLLLS
ncbi:SDR family NAD(P)-dependent oxidoreductase [Geminicoccus roseus]|uniref:SDR family NAD(P)-dependent oxidoreductase n=1 Tax=Geminicoccus roseus TaxID=404900 RepID=UPI000419646B|nr:SDR family oxidoreductase [Geminicoccus roseus]